MKQIVVTCFLLQAGFFLDFFLHSEDWGDILLPNVGWFSTEYTTLYPGRVDPSV
jgi:hypothetical protein